MKIAYLVNAYPRTSHSFIRTEIRALEALGVEVLRFSQRPLDQPLVIEADREEHRRTRVILSAGVAVHAWAVLAAALGRPRAFVRALATTIGLGWRSDRGLLRHLAFLSQAAVLERWLRGTGVVHLHAHFGTNSTAVALLTHLLGGPTFSCTVHGPDEFDNPELLKLREKISHASFVVAVSSYGRSQLYRWADHRDWGKVQVVHCGVDEGFLGGAPVPPPEAPRLVCVGRLSAQKGHLLLLEAAARLAADGTRFEILLVGDGPLRAAVEEQVRRLGLQDRIRLGGWMDAGQVREAILAARAFVLPSFAEGLPVVLMEALALGRPVISTAIAGIPELVLPGVTGWLVPAGSVEALVPAMREALEASPARLAELGRAGAALVAEQHDARREARKLLELFRSATGESVCLRPAAAPRAPAALAEEAAGASPSAIK